MLRLRCGGGSPRSLHLQAVPAMEFRVASTLASFSRTGFRNPGRPAYSLYQYCFPTSCRVAPNARLPAFAGDGSPVRTESRIIRRRWRRISGFPRIFALQCRLSICPPGQPRILDLPALPRLNPRVAPKLRFPRLAGWWLFGFPRFPHLPAMPVVNLRVAPDLRSPGCACCVEFRVASIPHPSALPVIRLWVAPGLRSSVASVSRFPGSPRFLVSTSAPAMEFRVAPLPRILRVCRIASSRFRESCFNGRSDDESRFLELCIL